MSYLFMLGPVGRAILRILRDKIRAAEAAHKAARQALQEQFEAEQAALELRLDQDIHASLTDAVNSIIKVDA